MKSIDPELLLLFVGIWLGVGVLIYVEHFFKDDGQVFQVLASVTAGFAGAFFGRISGKNHPKNGPGDAPTDEPPKIEV